MTADPHQLPGPPAGRLLNAAQVAELLGGGEITRETVIRRWRSWGLTGHRIGKVLRWREEEVNEYINSHRA